MEFLCARAGRRIAFLCPVEDVCGHLPERHHMLDVLYLALGIGGFALCIGYVHLCDKL